MMPDKESVASVLERDAHITIKRWLVRAHLQKDLLRCRLTDPERTKHLPQMIGDIVVRLRKVRVLEMVALPSPAAMSHGQTRHRQGYSLPMLVDESRILQVSLFETVQRHFSCLDPSVVLADVMLIADEVDSQLGQAVSSFIKAAEETAAA